MFRILPFLFLIVFSCKNAESTKSQAVSIQEIASAELGSKFEQKDNGDYSLCHSIEQVGNKMKTVMVVNTKTGKVVYGPKKLNADVEWFSETQLKIKEYPEVIQDQHSTETFIYYYDIIKQKKVSEKL